VKTAVREWFRIQKSETCGGKSIKPCKDKAKASVYYGNKLRDNGGALNK